MTTPATPDLAAELAELDALEEAPLDVDALERWLDAADAWVSDLCSGRRRWTMTVPAEPDRDSDLVIGTALELGRRAAGELRSLRARPPVDVERLADMAALRRDVLAMQPVRRTFAYRQGFDDAVLIVLARLRAAAAPAGED